VTAHAVASLQMLADDGSPIIQTVITSSFKVLDIAGEVPRGIERSNVISTIYQQPISEDRTSLCSHRVQFVSQE
jgi:hypothetical protein